MDQPNRECLPGRAVWRLEFSPAAPTMPRLTREFKALSAFRQANKRVVTCGDTDYYAP